MNTLPLNAVQKLFRSWESVHPYNAAQAVKIRGTFTAQNVTDAWEGGLASLGLGQTRVNCQTVSHLSPAVSVPHGATALLLPSTSLDEHLSLELNCTFADDASESPFRPFLIRDGEHSWIGLTYRHCVADSVSIRLVLREWVQRLLGTSRLPHGPVTHADDSYWQLFAARNGRVTLNQTLSTFLRGHHRLRTAQKPATRGASNYQVKVMLGAAPDNLISGLRNACRSRQTRVSDVMLAALLETARRHVPLQLRSNRRDVGVGCIVNLRPYASRNLAEEFGLFLGFTSIVGSPKDFSSRPGLLQSVQRQTALHRQRGIAPVCTVWVNAGLALGRFMPRRKLYHFYRKSMPLAAGLSSVNVPADDDLGPEVLDYVRISPTGPIAPAVLSTTEMNGRLSLALTYRPSVVTDESARAMLDDFMGALRIS